ncbi:hypothetical protein [Nocardia brasiliensis]|uniref:hypothetical protein n=1 Tax=Nocardia brasiliensis TaxID=37326 RepID=UPI002454D41F|nr:hypothetical protein [Nocardia brasiliensis]
MRPGCATSTSVAAPRTPGHALAEKFIKITSSKSAPIHVYWRGDNRVRCATKAGALLVN